MLEKYGHGGDLTTAEETFGLPPQGSFLDYSSNMNPLGPPPSVANAIRQFAASIDRYPDPAVRKLTQRLAAMHGIAQEAVLVGNGAAELIDLAARVRKPVTCAIPAPSFIEYADAVRKTGGSVLLVQLQEDDGFDLDRRRVEDALARHGKPSMWFIGSPNNPTGRLVDPAVIRMLLDDGQHVVLDEAFIDFVPNGEAISLLRLAAEHPRLIVLRSMTKFYAVPGIRLGYAVGHPDTIAAMRELQVPWSVNGLAQEIGLAVLDEEQYATRTAAWIAEERPYLEQSLAAIGLQVVHGVTNYVLFALPSAWRVTAEQLQRCMGEQGILIRDASRFEGLDVRYCRIAVKLRRDNDKLLAAMAQCLDRLRIEAEEARPE
jgi:threonine-phosphate decarboxylase